jgi:hypothetical protein
MVARPVTRDAGISNDTDRSYSGAAGAAGSFAFGSAAQGNDNINRKYRKNRLMVLSFSKTGIVLSYQKKRIISIGYCYF